jgi:pilus assembly protein Flp/PilA
MVAPGIGDLKEGRGTAVALHLRRHAIAQEGVVAFRTHGMRVFADAREETDMKSMINLVKSFVREEEGQDLIEYALLAALVALAATVAMTNLGTSISSVFGSVTGKLTASVPAA